MLDGTVLIVGGYGGVNVFVAFAELFDSRTGKFLRGNGIRSGELAVAREQHTATTLADGRVLKTGGEGRGPATPTAEVYTPSTGTFTRVGDLSMGRFKHSAALLPDGKVLITGGTTN